MSQPKISKLENGRLLPSVEDVQTLRGLYQAEAAEQDALLEVAGRLHSPIESNRTILRRGAARRQARLGELEHEATTLRYFSPIMIPGLLPTAEYMRRVFSLDLSGAELTRTVAARQARQQILYDAAKTFTFVITETALRWGFCPPDVMAGQASHIASLATLANVEIGVIFQGAAPAPWGVLAPSRCHLLTCFQSAPRQPSAAGGGPRLLVLGRRSTAALSTALRATARPAVSDGEPGALDQAHRVLVASAAIGKRAPRAVQALLPPLEAWIRPEPGRAR